jgi:Mg-chelatase subunit ChlD
MSNSVRKYADLLKEVVQHMIEYLGKQNSKAVFSQVTYSSRLRTADTWQNFQKRGALKKVGVISDAYMGDGGWTNTAAALDKATEFASSSPKDTVVILITDGVPQLHNTARSRSTEWDKTQIAKDALLNVASVSAMIAMGVVDSETDGLNIDKLGQLASGPEYAFPFDGYNDLTARVQAGLSSSGGFVPCVASGCAPTYCPPQTAETHMTTTITLAKASYTILLDSSGSIVKANTWGGEIDAAKAIVGAIKKVKGNVSLGHFDSNVVFPTGQSGKTEDALALLKEWEGPGAPTSRGAYTHTHEALREAADNVLGKKNQIIILITDGSPNTKADGLEKAQELAEAAAAEVAKKKIKLWGILVKPGAHGKAFEKLLSIVSDSKAYYFQDFDALQAEIAKR